MRRIFVSFFILFILSACSQGENINTAEDDEAILNIEDVEIPSEILPLKIKIMKLPKKKLN